MTHEQAGPPAIPHPQIPDLLPEGQRRQEDSAPPEHPGAHDHGSHAISTADAETGAHEGHAGHTEHAAHEEHAVHDAAHDAGHEEHAAATPAQGGMGVNRIALGLTALLLIAVVIMVPLALTSLVGELFTQETSAIFSLATGEPVDPDAVVQPDAAYVNITATNLDEAQRIVTLRISGHRICGPVCPALTGTFFSLGNDAARRQGLPPSAEFLVPGESGPYTSTVELPVRGRPQLYPFDTYTLLLGATVSATGPGGRTVELSIADIMLENVTMTLEDQVARLNMVPPLRVDPESVRSASDPAGFVLVDRLQWERPLYLRMLSVLLVLLISASGIFALGLRTLNELLLGIGGLILGIWGVRSVVVQSPLPDVTLVDLMLAFVILILLVAMALRTAHHFYRQSGINLRRR